MYLSVSQQLATNNRLTSKPEEGCYGQSKYCLFLKYNVVNQPCSRLRGQNKVLTQILGLNTFLACSRLSPTQRQQRKKEKI